MVGRLDGLGGADRDGVALVLVLELAAGACLGLQGACTKETVRAL